MAPVRAAAPGLWPVVVTVLDEAEARGWLGREVDAEPGS